MSTIAFNTCSSAGCRRSAHEYRPAEGLVIVGRISGNPEDWVPCDFCANRATRTVVYEVEQLMTPELARELTRVRVGMTSFGALMDAVLREETVRRRADSRFTSRLQK